MDCSSPTTDREAFAEDGWLRAPRRAVPLAQPAAIAISITTWKASPPTNARRRGANAGASLEDGVTFETLLGTDLDRRVHRRGLRPASRHLPAPRPRALSDARASSARCRRRWASSSWSSARVIGGETVGGGGVLLERRRAVRPLLGRERATPQPAFRNLLPPGHRVLHRARHRAASNPARRANTR